MTKIAAGYKDAFYCPYTPSTPTRRHCRVESRRRRRCVGHTSYVASQKIAYTIPITTASADR